MPGLEERKLSVSVCAVSNPWQMEARAAWLRAARSGDELSNVLQNGDVK